MKNKEILASAARLVGKEDVAAYFTGGALENTEGAKRESEFFTVALSLALNDIAHKKAAPLSEETVHSQGFVSYQTLSNRPMKILSVTSGGVERSFRMRAEGVETPVGEITLRYARFPKVGGLEEEADLASGVSPTAAVYFIAAESLAKDGAEARAAECAAKYEKLLYNGAKTGVLRLPERRWRG